MVALLLTTTITCSEAVHIISRIVSLSNLSVRQKTELIYIIQQEVPSCPLRIVPDERSKSNSR